MFGNRTQRAILREIQYMTTALEDLQASVASLTAITTEAVTLLNTLFAKLQASDAVAAADVEAQVTAINADVAALAAAVKTDTPAPPAAPAA